MEAGQPRVGAVVPRPFSIIECETLLDMNTYEKKIEKILVGVDFSAGSKWAVIEALKLAQQQNAIVHMLHIVEESMTEALQTYSKLNKQQVIDSVSERLESFCKPYMNAQDRVFFDIRVGHSVKDFGNVCDQTSPDLVVLGAWGSQDDNRSAGATVKQIIQECKCDVLLMHPRDKDEFKDVLACIDFSDYDLPIVRAADQLCLAEDCSLEILHVFYPPWKYRNLQDDKAVVVSADFETEYKAVLQGRLDALVPTNIHGVPTFNTKTTVLEHDKHSDGILQYLKSSNVDMVIIGARGQSRIESMILGRIAERIVTEAPCSVYIVKAISAVNDA